ncbi:HAMP domain-containing sensor histidine kinase [Paenibacillus sp. YPG26]|uniref:sensor histidine kinase n=1 Tax=Paenibacillus sp. YPG26 TaxID=2878915 RepID=UPI00203AE63D|nr:HAMP domain-containing sensor histidine kinase [Paenibacillus sp. YPG26]USB34356.1 HAMP domain-containing histidine kinase [Paenibacillus sp. YPG26]
MRRFGFTSIRLKLVLIFMGILLGSCQLAFTFAINFYFDKVLTDMESHLMAESRLIRQLAGRTDLSAEEIARLSRTSFYQMDYYSQSRDLPVSLDQSSKAQLEAGTSIYVPVERENRSVRATLFKLRERYVLLTPYVAAYFDPVAQLMVNTIINCAIIGSVLILIAVRQMMKPLRRLTEATREVAKGKFSVQVPYSGRDEVARLAQDFNTMVGELKQIEYLRKDFINNVSHEFRTPISSIQGFARLLQTSPMPREQLLEYTDVIIEETSRLNKLSSNILKLSRVENQTMPTQCMSFSLDEQIRRTILLLETEWHKKGLTLDLDLPGTNIYGDEELIQQIWINLLGNAIKFSDEGGTVGVSIARGNEVICVRIRDEGCGIPEPALSRIFEHFYQADSSRSRQGSGLGLAIVKRVTELCGGTVSVQSEEGLGSVFTVELPLGNRNYSKPDLPEGQLLRK